MHAPAKKIKTHPPKHFKGKEAIDHVIEARAKGAILSAETHGEKTPDHIFAAIDSAKDVAVALSISAIAAFQLSISFFNLFYFLIIFSTGWLFWKAARVTWISWMRLERLHRIIAEERWEIQHHREQEREELTALYRARGLQGKLLEEVVNILMADDDRLLQVMVEEELCLSLETFQHPLKQGLGAALGTLLASTLCLLAFYLFFINGLVITSFVIVAISGLMISIYEKNDLISSFIWNLATFVIPIGITYFLFQFFLMQSM